MGFVPVGARFSTAPLRSVEPVSSVAALIRSAPPLRFFNVCVPLAQLFYALWNL